MDGWMHGLPAGGGGVGGLGDSSRGAASAGAADDQIYKIIQIQSYIYSNEPWIVLPNCR